MSEERIEEAKIKGRTEALEFVGELVAEWKQCAKHANDEKFYDVANTLNQCAGRLDSKIEELANT